ncbi:MAG: YwbE family protein [Candidatus Methanomethylicus sp.]|nr:YwbE family protein [Candidatus Methanomethylicus sp.]
MNISHFNPIKKMQPNQQRSQIRPGLRVKIVQKQDQLTGMLTEGVVKDILTNSPSHPHGIKVRLEDGRVGRVQSIVK